MNNHFPDHCKRLLWVGALLIAAGASVTASAQGTSFTYQGRLQDGGANANGSYDFQFMVWDALSGGTQQPQPTAVTVSKTSVAVVNGIFSVQLDFGPGAFPGADRYLETSVRLAGSGPFTTLAPRQPVSPTPYAIRSATSSSADNATNANQLGGVAAAQYVITTDSRLSDARTPTAGSTSYIQNTSSQQTSSNFNISGNGTAGGTLSANTVNSSTTLNIGGSKVVSVSGDTTFPTSNMLVGVGAGTKILPNSNGDGSFNSFYGFDTGFFNTTGKANSFFGSSAGQSNTSGNFNSFFGMQSGYGVTSGANNSFFGFSSGFNNPTGHDNAFFGTNAGSNQTGNFHTYIGGQAGQITAGDANTFIGFGTAGQGQSSQITLIGYSAALGTANLTNATAIGAGAVVNKSNSLVLGAPGTNVGIGNTAPSARLDITGNANVNGNLTITGTLSATLPANSPSYIQNTTVQQASSNFNLSGNGTAGGTLSGNSINSTTTFTIGGTPVLGSPAANSLVLGQTGTNVGVGTTAPVGTFNVAGSEGAGRGIQIDNREIKLRGDGDGHFSIFANRLARKLTIEDTSANFNVGTAGSVLMTITRDGGNVGVGTTSPLAKLHVNGVIRMDALGSQQGIFPLCWNANNEIASCNSSSLRYKKGVQTFLGGLDIVNRLRPITFTWKESGMRDLGLAAEEVDRVEPLLTLRNKQGEIEGVKYNQLSAIFINAFKEQQAQIQRQTEQLTRQEQELKQALDEARRQRAALIAQREQLNELKQLVCRSHRRARACG